MLKERHSNQTTDEEREPVPAGNFINNTQASRAMNNAAEIPLLYIDDSAESKKAKTQLEKTHRYVVIEKVNSKDEKEALQPPILYTSDGVFKGLLAINLYAASNLWLTKRA